MTKNNIAHKLSILSSFDITNPTISFKIKNKKDNLIMQIDRN